MILASLTLSNFRRFPSLRMEFHPQMTVIVAKNGLGKTSVLDGVAIALGPFVGAFDFGRAPQIDRHDARFRRRKDGPEVMPQYPVEVTASFSDPALTVTRALTGPKSRTTVKEAQALAALGEDLQQQVRAGSDVVLPLVAGYGTARLWKTQKAPDRKRLVSEDRTVGYEDCFSSTSNYAQCQAWMTRATMAMQQERMTGDGAVWADRLAAVEDAVDAVLAQEGWSRFHYSFSYEELVMFSPATGTMPVTLLSDGVRAMVALVADIAFRCVRLNGFLGRRAVTETPGIVLIDEVDLHLHPAWQQQVLSALRRAFPRIQFIVSTHSPQVLSSVQADCIRLLTEEYDSDSGDWSSTVRQGFAQTLGVASSDILTAIMGVDPIPPVPEAEDVARYAALIRQDLHRGEEGRDLRARLIGHFGENHPVVQDCDRWIRLQTFKNRRPAQGPEGAD
ncbi:AAA family ATPase [Novispirillum itersonii]|uniref:Putative ATP-binding protein involved in virulence n=1 Tax=Novispirillum itersonii TaxID=189 RepID=A0A7X0DMI4_NOVIT|nr:AAA family ATPase [Novispirillum itersonii]MBB6211113.1 putative ATP-binding protein involved in virulence [Novispirillum itersonii]